ncbi:MAG: hypothetical protein V3T05_02300 [Myxococcota bacterium]
MKLHFVHALASVSALAVMGLACGHWSSDDDGMLRHYKPLAATDGEPESTHVSRSRLPMTNNAQSINAHAEPADPWESRSQSRSSRHAITTSRPAPGRLAAQDDAQSITDAFGESSDEAVAATLAAGKRRNEPALSTEPPEETGDEGNAVEATAWPEPASYDEAYDNSYAEASYDDDSRADESYDYDEDEPDVDGVEAASAAVADVAPARLTVRVRGNQGRCKVVVCGRRLGSAPFRDKAVEAGRHLVSVRCPKKRTFEELVEFEPGRLSVLFLEAGDFKGRKQQHKRRRRGRGRRR